jgi:hypothetical protein
MDEATMTAARPVEEAIRAQGIIEAKTGAAQAEPEPTNNR